MLTATHIDWLGQRGLQSATAEHMEVSSKRDSRGEWLCFPYRLDGQLVNRKFRMTGEKQHAMDKGGTLCLWNAEVLRSTHVVDHGGSVIITEGEFDALAAMQAGFPLTVSVPNGAPAEAMDDPANSKRYEFLWRSQADLERVKSFTLATDADAPGRQLAHDLAAILGPERCRFLTYPDGCKDLNEVLVRDGEPGVVRVINGAKPFPVRGLHAMSDFPEAPPLQGMTTGIDVLDPCLSIVPGTLTVLTGYANMGKSTVVNTVLARCIDASVPVAVGSFETLPRPILEDAVAKAMLACGDAEFHRHARKPAALAQIETHLHVITNALDDDLTLDVEAFLELARIAVLRHGIRVLVADPWNELEHKRQPHETITEYVSRAIRLIKAFAKRYQVAVWIVAHPTKPQKGALTAPSLYDISDSAHWANKADYGLVYHRKNKIDNDANLIVAKVRMGLPGRCDMVRVKFDYRTSRIAGYDA